MTDTYQKIIDDMEYCVNHGYDLDAKVYKDRLEALLAKPVAYMTHHDRPMLFPTLHEAASYCDDDETPIALIRAD